MARDPSFAHASGDLLSERRDGVVVITINRQESYNSWTEALREELARRLIEADADESVDAVVLTGAGQKAFCSGQDLNEVGVMPDGSGVEANINRLAACYDAVRNFGKPVVAAVNGVAAGSGFQLTQFCDYVVAHEKVRMGQTEVNAGIPSVFGTWLMWERIGSRAYELALQGRLMEAEEARNLGFVNEVVDQSRVLDVALDVARRLARQPRLAFRSTKIAIRRFEQERYRNALSLAIVALKEAYDRGEAQKEIGQFFESRRNRGAGSRPRPAR